MHAQPVTLHERSHKITSPFFKSWSATKFILIVADPFVVVSALVTVDIALIEWISKKIPYVVKDKNYNLKNYTI